MPSDDLDGYEATVGTDAPEDDAAGMPGGGDDDDEKGPANLDGGTVGFQQGRTISDATRAHLKRIAAAGKAAAKRGEPAMGMRPVIGYDEADASPDEPDEPATPAPAPGSPAAAAPAPAAAAPGTPPPEAIAAWERANAAQLAADTRAREVAAREKRVADLEGLHEQLFDDPVATWKAMIKRGLGESATDADVTAASNELLTELNVAGLGVTLPESITSKQEMRRLRRKIDKHQRDQAREAGSKQEQAAAAAKERKIAEVKAQIASEFSAPGKDATGKPTPAAKERYPWLAAHEAPSELLFDIMSEAYQRDGSLLSLDQAAILANDTIKNDATSFDARWRHLLTPAATATAPAAPASNQRNDRPSVTRSPTLTARTGSESAPVTTTAPSDQPPAPEPFNNDALRARSKARIRESFKQST